MSSSFRILIIGAAIWGVTLGVAFIGGLVVGKVQADDVPVTNVSPTAPAGLQGQQGQLSAEEREALRQRIQSGEATQEEIDQIRQRFQQGGGGGQRGPGGGGQRGQFGPGGGGGQATEGETAPQSGTN